MNISIEMHQCMTNTWLHIGNGAIDVDCNIVMDAPIPKWVHHDVLYSITLDMRAKQDQHQGGVNVHGKTWRWTV